MILAAAVIAFALIDFFFIGRYEPQRNSRSWKPRYWLTILLFTALLILQPLLLPWLGLRLYRPWGQWMIALGIVLFIASLALQVWARLHLGRFYAERADIQPGHQVVSSGPYAYVRHPLFLSYFLFAIGALMIAPSILMVLGVLYTFIDFSQAAKRDEQIMLDNVPDYADYMERTPRFIPRLVSRSTHPARKTGN